MSTYTPIKLGKTGKEVHAGEATVTGTRRIAGTVIEIKTYRTICWAVNTKNINNKPAATALTEDTPITCKRCLVILEKESLS